MQKRILYTFATLLLLTACNTNTPSAISVKNKIYKHPTAVQYLKFKTDSVQYYGDFGNEALSNQTFAYTQKGEVVTVFTPTPEHLLAYEGFVLRNGQQYELFADTSDPNYQDHQPQDPKAFSLVGKRYVYKFTTMEGGDTLEFLDRFRGANYSQSRSEQFTYRLEYPTLSIRFFGGTRDHFGEFIDTVTLSWDGEDYRIIK